jgi:hypothetical protein
MATTIVPSANGIGTMSRSASATAPMSAPALIVFATSSASTAA